MNTDLEQTNKPKKKLRQSTTNRRLIERLVKVSRVSKVTKGGKKLSFRAVIVVGEKGQVGVGVGKAADVAKVPEPVMEKHHSGKAPFCVDNQLIESKQE